MTTKLEICYSHLSELPSLEELPLEELHLEGNRLDTLDGLPMSLKKLNVRRNKLGQSGILFPFPLVEELNASDNRIRMFDNNDFLTCYPSLKTLILSRNDTTNTRFLFDSNVEELTIDDNPIRFLDGLPSSLKKLSVKECDLRMIQSRLPPTIERVNLASNHLRYTGLPLFWGTTLRSLCLEGNRIEKFPRNLPDTLEFLHLGRNSLEEVPQKLPSKLKVLLLYKNRLRKLPAFPRGRFEVLWIQKNCLVEIPHESVAGSFWADENWNEEEYHEAQRTIRKCWKRYVFTLRLRHFKRTDSVREELYMVSMMPERWEQIDTIDPVWFRKGPSRNHTDPH